MHSMKEAKQLYPEQAEGITAAMDLTLQKFEKLTIVTSLLQYFPRDEQFFMACSLLPKTVLSKENFDTLCSIFSYLKSKVDVIGGGRTITYYQPHTSLAIADPRDSYAIAMFIKSIKEVMDVIPVSLIRNKSTSEILSKLDSQKGISNMISGWTNFCTIVVMTFQKLGNEVNLHSTLNRDFETLKQLQQIECTIVRELGSLREKWKTQKDQYESKYRDLREKVQKENGKERKHLYDFIRAKAVDQMFIRKQLLEEASSTGLALDKANQSLTETMIYVKQSTKSLRGRRHYLEASLTSLIRVYDSTVLQFQQRIDELGLEEDRYLKEVEILQNKFKDVEEKYDEMRAMRRLKELLANMEKAEAIKQNWAARKIQVAWRKYKVAKLRKKKLKGRRKGKKKTPPPGKETSPGKFSTSDSRSRSKSQTP